ncbi:type III secretion regulatory protein HpaA [Paraburkholderia sp. JPY465]|uniref:hypothetical protein n=1 Tax=Paraburkholderia sp. JPY465 TaxID=3042285 RepID=UPI003D25D988
MTRVSRPPTIVSPAMQADACRERWSQTDVARVAVLYRGAIMFSYARTQHTDIRGSLLARKLAALSARRRNAVRRAGARQSSNTACNQPSEHAPDFGNTGRVTRDGDGGRGGGQPRDGRHGDDGAQPPMRVGQTTISRPGPGALQEFVAAQTPCTTLADKLPRLWLGALLVLRDEAAARPHARLDALLHERFIDLLTVQLQTGAPGDASIRAWRQLLTDVSGARGIATHNASLEADASAEISRAGRLNLLMPLLLLAYGRPSTPSMRGRALNVRIVQRGAALMAAERG